MKTRSKVLLLIVSAMALVIATIFGTLAYLTDTETVTNTFTVGHVDITLDEARVNDAGVPANATDIEGNVVYTKLYEDWKENGWKGADRVQKNEYHLVPGHVYVKDPTVTVKKGSEKTYVRMIVEIENIDKLEFALPDTIKNNDGKIKYYADLDGNNNNGLDFALQELLNNTWNYQKWDFVDNSYTEMTKNVEDGQETSNILVGKYEFRYVDTVGAWGPSTQDVKLEPLFTQIMIPGADIDNKHIEYLEDVRVVVTAHAIQADGFDNADAAWVSWQDNGSYSIETEATSDSVAPANS